MRSPALLILILVAALTFGCSVSPSSPMEITGPFKLVQFPDAWVKSKDGALVGVNDAVHYVVRKSKDADLLFAVKQGFDGSVFGKEVDDFPINSPDYDYYADDRYAVSLSGRIEKVTEEEWNGAGKALHSYHFIVIDDDRVTPEGVRFDDRIYGKAGESWGTEVALVSPRKTRIAVFSYTSREKVSDSWIPGLKNTEPGSGEVFLDIYDLSSGAKVGSVRSPYGRKPNGFAPSMLFSASLWIDDSYIVMPLDPDLTRCVLGVFPAPPH